MPLGYTRAGELVLGVGAKRGNEHNSPPSYTFPQLEENQRLWLSPQLFQKLSNAKKSKLEAETFLGDGESDSVMDMLDSDTDGNEDDGHEVQQGPLEGRKRKEKGANEVATDDDGVIKRPGLLGLFCSTKPPSRFTDAGFIKVLCR